MAEVPPWGTTNDLGCCLPFETEVLYVHLYVRYAVIWRGVWCVVRFFFFLVFFVCGCSDR